MTKIVRDIVTRNIVSIEQNKTVLEAARLMTEVSVFACQRVPEFHHVIHKLIPVESHTRIKFLHYITHS
jgi:CBS domain-containing protein